MSNGTGEIPTNAEAGATVRNLTTKKAVPLTEAAVSKAATKNLKAGGNVQAVLEFFSQAGVLAEIEVNALDEYPGIVEICIPNIKIPTTSDETGNDEKATGKQGINLTNTINGAESCTLMVSVDDNGNPSIWSERGANEIIVGAGDIIIIANANVEHDALVDYAIEQEFNDVHVVSSYDADFFRALAGTEKYSKYEPEGGEETQ